MTTKTYTIKEMEQGKGTKEEQQVYAENKRTDAKLVAQADTITFEYENGQLTTVKVEKSPKK